VSDRFAGRGVLVTGGARGIGRAIVEAFLAEGARVVAVDVLEEELERMRSSQADPGRVDVRAADLADVGAARGAVEDAIATLGRLDVLVNCAGVMPDGPFLEVDPAVFDRTFAVNVRAALATMQVAGAHFAERGGGAIVNIASANAFKNESPESVYNASKAALVALTKAVAHELGHLGVRANCVAPGQTLTAEELAAIAADPQEREVQHAYLRRVPLRRAGRPSEQAAAVLFLASEEASFVSGQTLIVDGGEVAGGDWYDERDAPPVPSEDA
jgi:NAD(P)-dependent dehydrogenase (short-subunit alcohol dehydrogenase family)